MTIKNTYKTKQEILSAGAKWRKLAALFQELCTRERRQMPDGTIMEQVKAASLPLLTFMNCVWTIVEAVNNEFGAEEVDGLFRQLDSVIPHKNMWPEAGATEYEYICNRLYERTIIFAGVYYILAVESPQYKDVLTAVYSRINYKEARPYARHFVSALREEAQVDDDEIIPPHIIPDIQALENGYKQLPPRRRLRQYECILAAIDAMSPAECTQKICLLGITVRYAIRILVRTYGLEENREFVPEAEKLTMGEIIHAYQQQPKERQKAIIPFLEYLLNNKEETDKDPYYRDLLGIDITVNVHGDIVQGDKNVGTHIDKVEAGGVGVQTTTK